MFGAFFGTFYGSFFGDTGGGGGGGISSQYIVLLGYYSTVRAV